MIRRLFHRMAMVVTFAVHVGMAALASGCSNSAPATETAGAVPRVTVHTVVEETFTPTIESFGSISFRNRTNLSIATDGTVARVLAEEGDRVTAGQLLMVLENLQLSIRRDQADTEVASTQAALRLARTRWEEGRRQMEARFLSIEKLEHQITQKELELELLEQRLDDAEKLFTVDGISREDIESLRLQVRGARTNLQGLYTDLAINAIGYRPEDLRAVGMSVPSAPDQLLQAYIELNTRTLVAELDVAQARVRAAEAELASTDALLGGLTIRSAGPAVVGARMAEVGERVTSGTPVMTLFDDREVYAVFPIQESRSGFIHAGQDVLIEIPAIPNTQLRGHVGIVAPTVDPQSGNLMVRALVGNPGSAIRPGMFARVSVITGQESTRIRIPLNSIVRKHGDDAEVFAVVNQHVILRSITVGAELGDSIEIVVGLRPDDVIVVSPPPLLREGMRVTVNENLR